MMNIPGCGKQRTAPTNIMGRKQKKPTRKTRMTATLKLSNTMKGRSLQEIADVVDYETPSAVKKRIDRIAEQYETFINPLPDGAERTKPERP